MWRYKQNELYHYGVKGQKWGVRKSKEEIRAEKKQAKADKKEVNRLHKTVTRTGLANQIATMGTLSKFDESDYPQLGRALASGRMVVQAKFKKNFTDKSVDVFVGKQKSPTIKIRMKNAEEMAIDFVNKAEKVNVEKFMKYYDKNF